MKKESTLNFIITSSNHILINCKINNTKARLLIDTGASNSCINYFSAEKFTLNFKKSNEKASSATNDIKDTFYSKNNILEINNFKINNFKIVLFDMTYINNSLKQKGIEEVDGILGGDILNDYNSKINYKKRTISFEF